MAKRAKKARPGHVVTETNELFTLVHRAARSPITGEFDAKLAIDMLNAFIANQGGVDEFDAIVNQLPEPTAKAAAEQQGNDPDAQMLYRFNDNALSAGKLVRIGMTNMANDLQNVASPRGGTWRNRIARLVAAAIKFGMNVVRHDVTERAAKPFRAGKKSSESRKTILADRQRIATHNRQTVRELWQRARTGAKPPKQRVFVRSIAERSKLTSGRKELGLLGDKPLSESTVADYLKRSV